MRAFARLRIAAFLDVEKQPVRILAHVLAPVVFLGALAIAVPLRKDADGLTAADRALCTCSGAACASTSPGSRRRNRRSSTSSCSPAPAASPKNAWTAG